jgi:hypothetical protein
MYKTQVLDNENLWYTIAIGDTEVESIYCAFQWHKNRKIDETHKYRIVSIHGYVTTQFDINYI